MSANVKSNWSAGVARAARLFLLLAATVQHHWRPKKLALPGTTTEVNGSLFKTTADHRQVHCAVRQKHRRFHVPLVCPRNRNTQHLRSDSGTPQPKRGVG